MVKLLPCRRTWKQFLPFWPDARHAGLVHDNWRLRDGATVTLRPARATDAALIQDMVRGLSAESRYHRFFYPLHEVPPDLLARFTLAEPAQAMTLLATVTEDGRETAVAMAQYVAEGCPAYCDFAVVVTDARQRNGLATRMLRALIRVARSAGIERMEGDVLAENEPMRRLMLGMGFRLERHPDGAYLRKAWKQLSMPNRRAGAATAA
ncbi:MAG TPA: GNAT family N-acetyltransferase [Noviherbaspirillum sp.]|jgi:acetyltransferase|uniref:GNAT family N-acetyltransferase n=1 Tax=Noviherbaspirillum sp. TaxID=1926288 RepID=UPI002F927230